MLAEFIFGGRSDIFSCFLQHSVECWCQNSPEFFIEFCWKAIWAWSLLLGILSRLPEVHLMSVENPMPSLDCLIISEELYCQEIGQFRL